MDQLDILLSQNAAKIGLVLDSVQTASLSRELEHVKAKTYDVLYTKLKARQFIPVSNEADPGAETITYRSWDHTGMAEIIANGADDLSLVDAFVSEESIKVHSLGKAYRYTLQDLRRAAMSGNNLDARKAMAARLSVERRIDQLAATGNANAGIEGMLNNSNVPIATLPTGTWSTATSAQIIADLNFLVQSIVNTTKDVHAPDTLILDTASFSLINQKPMSTTGDTGTTVLRSFLENNPYITDIDQWTRADTAASGSPRICAYQRDPMVLELEIPQEFEQLPPQAKNLAFIVPCHARFGGCVIRYPLAMAYADNM